MREILFRGFNVNEKGKQTIIVNGKEYKGNWVFGGIYQLLGTYHIKNLFADFIVLSETVGQFTGLTDKNGKNIFEGDLCHLVYPKKYQAILKRSGNYDYSPTLVYKVEYQSNKFELFSVKGDCYESCIYQNDDRITVIGNIHDNPGLLEVEDE